MSDQPQSRSCGSTFGGSIGIGRREFLKIAAVGAGSLAAGIMATPAVAGPFTAADFEKLVPADKKLSAEWVKSLYAKGTREVYRGDALENIGMPVGGICAGQLYLGGDGKLWHWDIFNQHIGTGAGHYAKPMTPASPLEQGFAIRVTADGKTQTRNLDKSGFANITFCGEYPLAFVEYRDDACPVAVSLEAFSPFIPLNTEESSLPATVMRFTVRNTSQAKMTVEVAGWLENAICLHTAKTGSGTRQNRIMRKDGLTLLECSLKGEPLKEQPVTRADIVFEDFEKPTYEGWTVTGTAFGPGPIEKAKMPAYQGDVASQGQRLANSHNVRDGGNVTQGDAHTGMLTSKPFTIERTFITFLIGGGNHKGTTCMNLLVDGKAVESATGANDNRMKPAFFDVRKYAGRTAQLQIVDNQKGAWGNIGIDQIVFTDKQLVPAIPLDQQYDYGTMGLAVLDEKGDAFVSPAAGEGQSPARFFAAAADASAQGPLDRKLLGSVGRRIELDAGQSATVTFIIAWRFDNLKIARLAEHDGRRYGKRFADAAAVAEHVARNFDSLRSQTHLWHDTWYDSTLPFWFLNRTFANASILATSTCYWLGNGRFYGWEGVGCCPGTCAHVWHYAHAVGRLFPDLERSLREMVDFGVAMQPNGAIFFRGEYNNFPAADGQAGVILRAYREHQMSADDAFLKRNWAGIKKALMYLVNEDANDDGILEGKQHNTLDTDWYGPVSWLSSLYLAALRAGEEMAREVGDEAFASRARAIFEKGQKRIVELCWNGEYFVQKPDPKHAEAMKVGNGCEIDQVFGQSWAYQVNLGRIIDQEHTLAALRCIWRYNFTPDVGPYRNANKLGRWYAMPGEGGVLMCTWPKGDKADAQGKAPDWAFGYFNECMNGFEYQVAGHMIWEGLVQEGLAVARMLHDRHHPSRRNPWNEIECGDHYARSMASYGVYLAACGYACHGPKGHLAFAPRVNAEDFRAAFTAAQGWGTLQQTRSEDEQKNVVSLRWGALRLTSIGIELPEKLAKGRITVARNGAAVPAQVLPAGATGRVEIRLPAPLTLAANDTLLITAGA